MMLWFSLALASGLSRRFAMALVVLSVAVSTILVVSVAQLRADARSSFSQAVSGVDLIVGPRGSPSELMLYSVFQLGRPTRNIDARVWSEVEALPSVRWVVPLQLGDSLRGFPVWGTTTSFFEVFQTQGQAVAFAEGRAFIDPRVGGPAAVKELVLGAEVARALGLALGDSVVISHGAGGPLAQEHTDHPFQVVGILSATGAPVDRAALMSLEGFEAMHQGWGLGSFQGLRGLGQDPAQPSPVADVSSLAPTELTALLVGLQSRGQVFTARRQIESLPGEPLMAVLPGVALDDLWRVIGVAEQTLLLVGLLVAVASLLSVAAVLLVSLASRRKEFAILRALGASAGGLMTMVLYESMLICLAGLVMGLVVHQLALWALAGWLQTEFGIVVSLGVLSAESLTLLGLMLGLAILMSLLPAIRAYRLSLADGLNPPSGA